MNLSNEVLILILNKCNNNTLIILQELCIRLQELISYSYYLINLFDTLTNKLTNIKYVKFIEGNELSNINYLNNKVIKTHCVIINGDIKF